MPACAAEHLAAREIQGAPGDIPNAYACYAVYSDGLGDFETN